MGKGVKEVQGRIEELEEELEAERQSRSKAERQRSDLAREIEELGHRLDEAGGATNAQVELNKKRENEIAKLRKDMEEANIQHESILAGLKKKQGDAIGEMNEQVDQLQKMKAKIDKDKTVIMHEIQDTRAAADEVNRSKSSAEKSVKALQGTLADVCKKIDEASMVLGDFESNKRKMACENADLLRAVGELSNNLQMLTNAKGALAAQLDEVKQRADNESRERSLLLGKFRNLEHETDGAREALEEICNERENLMRQVGKAESDAAMWRQKYETEAVAKAEELEMTKMKLGARLTEAESMIENLSNKLHQVEKSKAKVSADLDEMNIALDQAQQMHAKMERQAKQFDKVIGEWKTKVDSLSRDLDNSQKETVLQLDEVREENKVLRSQLELTQVQQEIARRIAEKEEEFMLVKKNFSKAHEGMQLALETESKAKAEALRMKKKLEGDVADLDIALDHANAGALETQGAIKKYAAQIRDAQANLEEESRQKSVAQDALVVAERKACAARNALEEARSLLETTDRNRRAAEQDLSDTNEELAEATNVSQALTAAKRKLEAEVNQMHADLDEMASEARMSEEKAQRAMVDAARLADELRVEQDLAVGLERERKVLEAQVKDSSARCDEAEVNALKGGKKAVNKMESRIRELESEMDAESRRFGDAQKNLRKSERKIKELTFAADEDKKNHESMQALIDQMQGKVRSYKKQIEEAEEIAALNLAKFRQTQNSLGSAEERAEAGEAALAKSRLRARSASLGPA